MVLFSFHISPAIRYECKVKQFSCFIQIRNTTVYLVTKKCFHNITSISVISIFMRSKEKTAITLNSEQ